MTTPESSDPLAPQNLIHLPGKGIEPRHQNVRGTPQNPMKQM